MLAVAFMLCATSAWAVDKENPVTGETEAYSNIFTGGTSSEWNLADNWTLATESKVPFVSSGDYNAALVDGTTATSASTAIDGWQLRVGAYNGATVTWSSGIAKIQASNTGCWLTADENSSITIASFSNNQLEGSDTYPFKLSSAKAGGITWSAGLTGASNTSLPFWYYLKGTGTVVYGGNITVANAQVIKQADASLSGGSKSVVSKDLVTFGSGTTKAFTADASVLIKQSNVTKTTRTLKSVTAGGAPVKLASATDWQVGTCELVQTSIGVKLYYVDGDYDTSYMAYVGDDPTANRYYSVAAALDAIEADYTLPKKITLLLNTEEDIVIPSVDFVFDSNGKTITGTISGASGVGLSESAGVYTGISNTAATWTGTAGDGLWENAQNWSTKSVPTSSTTVTFNDDAIVNTPYDSAVAYGIVISEGHTLTLRRAGQTPGTAWSTITVGAGAVSGNGTIKLVAAGINKSVSSFTIGANIEFENDGSHDSFLGETVSGSFVINGTVTGTGYFQVKTSTTFNGNVTIPGGSLIKVNSWTYNLGNNASLYGAGTLKFDAVAPSTSMKTALQDKDKWTGVCEIYNKSINDINANNYGNVNSTVRYNGVTGYSAFSTGNTLAVGNVKCIDIGANGLTYNNGFSSNNFGYTYACALTGTGTITFGSTYGGSGTYTFTGDASAFAGTISYGSIAADKKAAIVFNSTDNASPTVGKGQLGVAAGTTLGLAGFTGTVVGSGTIALTIPDPNSSVRPTFDSSWTGTVILPSKQGSMTVNLAWWGVTGSKIKVMGFQGSGTGNSVKIGTDAVAATVELAGNVRLQNGDDDTTYTIAALTGTGAFNTTLTGTPGSTTNMRSTYSFTKLTDYTGTISTVTPDAGEGKTWWTKVAIGTVNVSSLDLTSSSPIVKLGGTHNLVSIPTLTVNDVATSHELYQAADGNLYVKVASVTVNDVTTYYPTLQEAANAAIMAGGTTIKFTRIDSEAATSLAGWTYEDGVFTLIRAYNATTGTEYATLASAVAAASTGDTIKLMFLNTEAAVDTTDKDFIFDENGCAFGGTWTGSGRIVLKSAPSTTTWSSAKFVTEGWTGTVTLDWGVVENRSTNGNVTALVNKYGTANSTVEIGKNSRTEGNCYFDGDPTPKLKVSGYLYINDGASGTKRNIGNVCGDGVFVFGDKANTVNYGITNLNDWNGILTNKSAKVTVGTVTRGNGTIYCTNKPTAAPTFTDTEGNRWTGRFIVGWNQTSSGEFAANSYGISGSIVEIPEGITILGHIPSSGGATLTVNPTINVAGSLTIDNGYSNANTTFSKITGSGNFEISFLYQNYFVDTMENWNGHFLCSTGYSKIINLVSGSGEVKFNRAPTALPTTIGADWSGSFVMNWTPSYDSTPKNTAWVLDNYGVSGSTVVIAQAIEHGYLKDKSSPTAPSIAPAVYLKANLTVDNGFYNATTTFSQLGADEGVVFKTRSSGDGTPYAVTLLKDFAGSFNLLYGSRLTIDTIERNALPSAGDLVVSATAQTDTSTPASFNVASTKIRVGGVDTVVPLAYSTSVAVDESGLYKAVAQINTTYYATMQEAITVAGDSNLASITVLDGSAALPDGYYKNNGVVTKYPVALVTSGASDYQPDVQSAIIAAEMAGCVYDYIEILVGGNINVPLDILESLKIKNTGGATLAFTGVADDCAYDEDASNPAYTVYTKSNKPTTYTWVGGVEDTFYPGSYMWTEKRNWRYVNNSSETVIASRQPQAGDSVVFTTEATVTIMEYGTTVAAITVNSGATCQLVGSFTALALGTVTANAGTLIVTAPSGVTPTYTLGAFTKVNVEDGSEGAKVYTFSLRSGTIFSVY